MAAGDVKFSADCLRHICVLSGATAANGQPSGASAGVPCYDTNVYSETSVGACYQSLPSRESTVLVASTAGSGTMTVTIRLWGYNSATGEWFPLGTGADASKGVINAGAAIGEVKTDKILHAEPLLMAGHFDRLYAEITAIGGTATAVDVWLISPRHILY